MLIYKWLFFTSDKGTPTHKTNFVFNIIYYIGHNIVINVHLHISNEGTKDMANEWMFKISRYEI